MRVSFVVVGLAFCLPAAQPLIGQRIARPGTRMVRDAEAARPSSLAQERVRQALSPDRGIAAAESLRVRLRGDQTLASAAGFRSRPYTGSAREAALAFLREHAILDPLGTAQELLPEREARLGENRFVYLQQAVDGIPVHSRSVTVMLDEDNAVRAVNARISPGRKRPEQEWVFGQQEAFQRALEWEKREDGDRRSAERVWFDDGLRLIPAWKVYWAGKHMDGSWISVVSAEDGTVLASRSTVLRQSRTARAQVFPKNPVTSKLSDTTLPRLTAGSALLFGQNVKVYSYYKTLIGSSALGSVEALARADSGGAYMYQPFGADPRFSEVELYYMVDRVTAAFKSLGWPGFYTPLAAVAHWSDCTQPGDCVSKVNAHFNSQAFNGDGGVFFYHFASGVDLSYDGDVIAHEVAHAVVNDIVGSDQGETFSALNEGTADYFSSSFLGDAPVGEFTSDLMGLRIPHLRTPDNNNSYPKNLIGECHRDGNIWSGALWDVRSLLGAEVADTVALYSLASVGPHGEFYDAGYAAVDAAAFLFGRTIGSLVELIIDGRGVLSEAASMAGSAHELWPWNMPVIDSISPAETEAGMLAWRQYTFSVPPGVKTFKVTIYGNSPILALIKHRSPVVVYDDGTSNAEYQSEIAKKVELTVDESSDPEIQQGRYYLWVAHFNTSSRTEYAVLLTESTGGGKINATRMTELKLDGPTLGGSIPSGEWLNSRQFLLKIPSTATAAGVGLAGDRDVDLYLRYKNPVSISSQGYPEGDISSTSSANEEILILTRGTIPNLRAGDWIVGVVNYDADGPAHFLIRAVGTTAPVSQPRLLQAASGTTYTVAMPETYGAPMMADDQYAIAVPASAQGLRVQVTSADVDATVYLRRGQQVAVQNGAVVSDSAFRARYSSTFELTTSQMNPLQAGTWYVGFSNASAKAGRVSFRLTLF